MKNTAINKLQLITAIIVLLCTGVFLSWYIISIPFRQVADDIIENATQLRINNILVLIFLCIGAVISLLISKYVTLRLRLILCALMLFTSYFSLSMQTITFHYTNNYILLYLSYAVLGGTASGIILKPTGDILNILLNGKKLITSVIVFGCILIGSFLLGNLIKALVGPEAGDWKEAYTVIAIIIGAIVFISSFILKQPNESYVKSMKIEEEPV